MLLPQLWVKRGKEYHASGLLNGDHVLFRERFSIVALNGQRECLAKVFLIDGRVRQELALKRDCISVRTP